MSEAISYALTTEEKSRQFVINESNITRLDWPMSEERFCITNEFDQRTIR